MKAGAKMHCGISEMALAAGAKWRRREENCKRAAQRLINGLGVAKQLRLMLAKAMAGSVK